MHVNFIPFQIYFFQLSRALVASSPEELQAMLDIVATYADKWQYQLNADKSSVMVLGESAKTRLSGRLSRKWYIGREEISETDEQHHLGIGRSVHLHNP